MGEGRSAYRVLVGKPERKIPLGWPTSKWENTSKMDFQEVAWTGTNWTDLAQSRDRS
jgi:hypothetical protein